jgi:uncharacterized membrane protein
MTAGTPSKRIESVDLLRGVVMILMALDHTRDYFGTFGANPTDLATTTVPLFFTRCITHLCAPVFFLLTGTGAGLASATRSTSGLSRYLILRGLLLIVLELTVIRCLAYQFNFDYQVTLLLVIWALGWAMIFLGLIVVLPVPAIAAIGLALIVGHNAFDRVPWNNPFWSILHRPGFVLQGAQTVFVAYPLIPWIGVTAVGFALARVYAWEPERRRRFLLVAGVTAIAGFIVLRAGNIYGDPFPGRSRPARPTVLSFINATKYPPSLLFLLMTLGPALLILRTADRGIPGWLRPAINYGRAPFFYYFVHFALIHWLATLTCLVRFGSVHWMLESPTLGQYPFTPPPGWGFPPVVYGSGCSSSVCLLACRSRRTQGNRRHRWLTYF